MVDENTPSKTAGHELSDLDPKSIALFAVALVVTLAVVFVLAYTLLQRFLTVEMKSQAVPSPLSYTREPMPEPHLEVNPGQELKTMRAEEDKILKSYDWIDQEKGIMRIPIDRAIEIIAQRGLPARPQSGEKPK
jgi:hypothetical protein